ncbi:MAG TPA: electron transfer flavoprotein subunit beta/FixA family protein [Gemmatimonadaceae bacterium]|nr:electron transfer flavoprotein subunit beta/FixA family protein [Gemmatimonadaceae bacterium]
MRIAVCIKRVPVMDVKFRIAGDGKSIDETGLKYDVNDFDLWAVEAALQLREKTGDGEVAVFSIGPDAVQEQIRKALSMGADRGVHLKADRAGGDPLSIARALAAELKATPWDVIFFGKVAIDSADQSVGPMVAELLGLPCVSAIASLEIANGKGTAKRELEGASEIVEFPLPVVLTVDEGLNKERLPSLKGIMAAKKKPLESRPVQIDGGTVSVVKMELPAERAAGRIIGEGAAAVPELIRLLQTEAKVL